MNRFLLYRCYWIYIYIIVLTRANLLHAQYAPYQLYGVPDGLSQTQILKLYCDTQGFIWAGTHGGINRFDGHKFENIRTAPGWYKSHISSIIEGFDKHVYYTTPDGLVMHQDTGGDIVVDSLFKSSHIFGLDESGKFWLKTQGKKGVAVYTYKEGKREEIPLLDQLDPPGGYSLLQLRLIRGGDKIWVVFLKDKYIDKEIRQLDYIIYQVSTKTSPKILREDHFSFQNKHIEYLFLDNYHQQVYFCTPTEILQYTSTGWTTKWKLPAVYRRRLFKVDKKNRLIAAEKTDDKDRFYDLLIFEKDQIKRQVLQVFFVNDIVVDHENNIWLGTESGLIRVMGEAFTHYDIQNDSLPNSSWSVVTDQKGDIWVASYGSGIHKYISGEFERIPEAESLFERTGPLFYMGAIRDHQSRLWFPHARGIAMFENDKWQKFKLGRAVMSIYDDRENQEVWFGALSLYKWKNGQLIDSIPREKIGNEAYIVSINKDKTGTYWLGTHRRLFKYDGKNHFEKIAPTREVPFKGAISSLRDHRGNMWFGTHDGLTFYDYDHPIRAVGQDVLNRSINFIAQSDSSKLFLGLLEGLGVIDLATFYHTGEFKMDIYDKNSGFIGIECGQNGVHVDDQGNVWMLTSNKLTRLEPDKLQPIKSAPVSRIKTFSIQIEKNGKPIWENTKLTKLSNKQNSVRFGYSCIFYTKPDAVHYQYRLNGYASSWSEETQNDFAEFTHLSPGDYTFEVRAKHSQSDWSTIASQQFIIEPAFWQTWWFKLWGVLLLIGGIAYISVWINEYQRRKKEIRQQTQGMISSLKLKTLTNQVNPHFAANLIAILQSDVLNGETTHAMNLLARFGKLFRAVLVGNDEMFISVNKEMEFVKNYLSLEKARFKDKLHYKIHIDPQIPLNTSVPKMLIQTYVNNAIKHGLEHKQDSDWQLHIQIKSDENRLYIQVEDNGVGRKAAEMLKINSRSTGKGFEILDEIFEWLNLHNSISSYHQITDLYNEQGHPAGTRVNAQLPLKVIIPNHIKGDTYEDVPTTKNLNRR